MSYQGPSPDASPAGEAPPGRYIVLSAERRVGYSRATPLHCPTLARAMELAANMAAADGGEFMVLHVLGTMQARAHWEPALDPGEGPDASSIYP